MATLSPYTRSRLRERELLGPPTIDTSRPGWADEYKRYECPACETLHKRESDAEWCCPRRIDACWQHPTNGETYMSKSELIDALNEDRETETERNCPVCGSQCDDAHDAASCCLWRDLAPDVRYRIAAAVEGGADWPEAIEREVAIQPQQESQPCPP